MPEISVTLIDDYAETEVISRTGLAPDEEHELPISPTPATSCFVRCFHEGGIARINLFGEGQVAEHRINLLEQATITHVSNEHYGHPADAVAGNREVDYMLGWESARSGFGEQALFHLAAPAVIDAVIVDTYLHRLNSPLSCHVFALNEADESLVESHMQHRPRWTLEFSDGYRVQPDNFQQYMAEQLFLDEDTQDPAVFNIRLLNELETAWQPLISFGKLRPDTWHRFDELEYDGPSTHLLYMHYPNGGIHGLKAFGR